MDAEVAGGTEETWLLCFVPVGCAIYNIKEI